MKTTDATVKLQIVLITGLLALVGFFLEVGPVAGSVFGLTSIGLSLGLQALGFLAYLALAAAAAVGLHLGEKEKTPKKEGTEEKTPLAAGGDGEMVGERVAIRPELSQMRMFFTALGGYTLLKGLSMLMLIPLASRYNIQGSVLLRLFNFGFAYVAIGWFLLVQFVRWYAQRRRWIRLQEEFLGVDINRIIAIGLLIKPVIFFATAHTTDWGGQTGFVFAALLHLLLVTAAGILWFARPIALRRTIIGLLAVGAGVIIITVIQAIGEAISLQ